MRPKSLFALLLLCFPTVALAQDKTIARAGLPRAVTARLNAIAENPATRIIRDSVTITERIDADVVVSNADLKRTVLELVGESHFPAAVVERVRAFRMSLPLFTTYLDLDVDLAALGMPANASVFTVAYDQIADHLDGGPLPHCTDDDGVAVNEIGFSGIESALTGKRIALP